MSTISSAKEIANLVRELGDTDLYRKMVELEREIVELIGENNEMVKKLRELEEQLNTAKDLTFRKPFYYASDDTAPYCPHCWEVENTQIHLQGPNESPGGTVYSCTNCKENYWTEIRHPSLEPAEPRIELHELQRELMDRDPEP